MIIHYLYTILYINILYASHIMYYNMYSMFYIQIRYTYLYIYVHIILYVTRILYIYMHTYMDTYIYIYVYVYTYTYCLHLHIGGFKNLGLDKCNITRFQYMEYFDGNGQTSSILFEVQCKVRILNRSLPYLKQPRKWKLTHWKTSCFPKKNNRILLPGLRSGILFSQSGYGSRCSNPA